MKVHRIRVGIELGGQDFDQFTVDAVVPNGFDKWSEQKKEEYLEKNSDKYLEEAMKYAVPFIKDWQI